MYYLLIQNYSFEEVSLITYLVRIFNQKLKKKKLSIIISTAFIQSCLAYINNIFFFFTFHFNLLTMFFILLFIFILYFILKISQNIKFLSMKNCITKLNFLS